MSDACVIAGASAVVECSVVDSSIVGGTFISNVINWITMKIERDTVH